MRTVGDLVAHLDARIPFSWAEDWDRVGLLVGDPGAPLSRIFVSVDPTPGAYERARQAGCRVLLTHHPLFLEPPDRLLAGAGPAGLAYRAAADGIALIACHTNLDRAPEGADALAVELGLTMRGPLETGGQPVAVVAAYVPGEAAEAVRGAMAAAGAGRIGRYEDCSFTGEGIGRFTPGAGADPTVGVALEAQEAGEQRVEMLCARAQADAVIAAARAAHPYEEPVIVACDGVLGRGAARMGRLCDTPAGMDLRAFARLVGERLGVRPVVWGDPDAEAGPVALAPGSGRSLVGDALSSGARTLVTGELRYHETHDAYGSGLAVVIAGHDATEWPLTRALARIASEMCGSPGDDVIIDDTAYPWWTA